MEGSDATNLMLKKAISLAFSSGYQLDKDSFIFLKDLAHKNKLENVMDTVLVNLKELPENPLFITRAMIEQAVQSFGKGIDEPSVASGGKWE